MDDTRSPIEHHGPCQNNFLHHAMIGIVGLLVRELLNTNMFELWIHAESSFDVGILSGR